MAVSRDGGKSTPSAILSGLVQRLTPGTSPASTFTSSSVPSAASYDTPVSQPPSVGLRAAEDGTSSGSSSPGRPTSAPPDAFSVMDASALLEDHGSSASPPAITFSSVESARMSLLLGAVLNTKASSSTASSEAAVRLASPSPADPSAAWKLAYDSPASLQALVALAQRDGRTQTPPTVTARQADHESLSRSGSLIGCTVFVRRFSGGYLVDWQSPSSVTVAALPPPPPPHQPPQPQPSILLRPHPSAKRVGPSPPFSAWLRVGGGSSGRSTASTTTQTKSSDAAGAVASVRGGAAQLTKAKESPGLSAPLVLPPAMPSLKPTTAGTAAPPPAASLSASGSECTDSRASSDGTVDMRPPPEVTQAMRRHQQARLAALEGSRATTRAMPRPPSPTKAPISLLPSFSLSQPAARGAAKSMFELPRPQCSSAGNRGPDVSAASTASTASLHESAAPTAAALLASAPFMPLSPPHAMSPASSWVMLSSSSEDGPMCPRPDKLQPLVEVPLERNGITAVVLQPQPPPDALAAEPEQKNKRVLAPQRRPRRPCGIDDEEETPRKFPPASASPQRRTTKKKKSTSARSREGSFGSRGSRDVPIAATAVAALARPGIDCSASSLDSSAGGTGAAARAREDASRSSSSQRITTVDGSLVVVSQSFRSGSTHTWRSPEAAAKPLEVSLQSGAVLAPLPEDPQAEEKPDYAYELTCISGGSRHLSISEKEDDVHAAQQGAGEPATAARRQSKRSSMRDAAMKAFPPRPVAPNGRARHGQTQRTRAAPPLLPAAAHANEAALGQVNGAATITDAIAPAMARPGTPISNSLHRAHSQEELHRDSHRPQRRQLKAEASLYAPAPVLSSSTDGALPTQPPRGATAEHNKNGEGEEQRRAAWAKRAKPGRAPKGPIPVTRREGPAEARAAVLLPPPPAAACDEGTREHATAETVDVDGCDASSGRTDPSATSLSARALQHAAGLDRLDPLSGSESEMPLHVNRVSIVPPSRANWHTAAEERHFKRAVRR